QVKAETRPVETKPAEAKPTEPKPDDARGLLRQARELCNNGKIDEAEKVCQRAALVPSTRWGLFEDSPDKPRADAQQARAKRDRDESVGGLTEARQLFARGELQQAKSKAYQAKQLHGPYTIWDMGDRPDKLLNEIETAELKQRRSKTSAPEVKDTTGRN